jgi:hypothetical protein
MRREKYLIQRCCGMKFLILCHPRSGSSYAASLLNNNGYDVGHERMKTNGLSSWFWASKDESPPFSASPYDSSYEPDLTIHIIRNPLHCIASVAYTESTTELYRSEFVEITGENILDRAASSILGWNNLCQQMNPDFTIKTESLPSELSKILGKVIHDIPPQNTRPHPVLQERLIASSENYWKCLQSWNNAMG